MGKDNATPTVYIDNTYHLWERLCGSFDEYFDREQEANFEETKRRLQTEIDSITFMKDSLQRQKEALEGEVSVKTVEVTGLKSTVAELQTAQVGIAAQLDATKVCSPLTLQLRMVNFENDERCWKFISWVLLDPRFLNVPRVKLYWKLKYLKD